MISNQNFLDQEQNKLICTLNKDEIQIKFDCSQCNQYRSDPTVNINPNLDYRLKLNITIKRAESLIESFALSAVSQVENLYEKKYGVYRKFSYKQLMDCYLKHQQEISDYRLWNNFLEGGGIAFDKEYKAIDSNNQCLFDYTMAGIQIVDSHSTYRVKNFNTKGISKHNERLILLSLIKKGPLRTWIKINNIFKNYKQGIIQDSSDDESYNQQYHPVLIVGYDSEQGIDYWIIQNTWGTEWGENGYARIQRAHNILGVEEFVTFPGNIIDPEKEPKRLFQRHLHDESTGAKCSDGSSSGIYFSKGFGSGLNKTIMYFHGGGWCFGQTTADALDLCTIRTNNRFGTTKDKFYTITKDYSHVYPNITQRNELFHNWNRFILIYCDGTSFAGYKKDPVIHKNKTLYFRGYNSTIEDLKFINKLLPAEKTDTYIANGCSAGGLAIFIWSDFINDYLKEKNPKIKYFGMPEGGFYEDFVNIKTKNHFLANNMKSSFDIGVDISIFPNQKCIQANLDNPARCFLAEHLVKHLHSPIFILQSGYDSRHITLVQGFDCLKGNFAFGLNELGLHRCKQSDIDQIEPLRVAKAALIQESIAGKDNVAVFYPSCVFHCYCAYGNDELGLKVQVPYNSNNTLANVLSDFMKNLDKPQFKASDYRYFDEAKWPENRGCS